MALGRLRVVLGLSHRLLVVLSQAKTIHDGMEANASVFTSPSPPLPTLLSQIEDCEKSQQTVGTRVKGAAEARKLKFDALVTSLESERMYVQSLCDGSPEQAANLIKLAGMQVASVGRYQKPILVAMPGVPAGTVDLEANARLLDKSRKGKFYSWRYTLDGGKTFLAAPSTGAARTSISGLPLLTVVGFQVSVTVNKSPPGDWSQLVSILVH